MIRGGDGTSVFSRTKLRTLLRLVFGNRRERRYLFYFLGLLLHGIDVSTVSVEALGLEKGRSECYGNSGGPDLEVVLESLPVSPSDSVLDIGCGKGGAMITMAKYGFARIDGIELSERLAEIAEKHLNRAKIRNASIFRCDAADFEDFDPYTVLYMYHPFGEAVTRQMLDHLAASVARCPRRVTLLYRNPVYHELLLEAGFRLTGRFNHLAHPFHVYTFVRHAAEALGYGEGDHLS